MFGTEVAQLRTDFGYTPDLVDEYVVHTPRDEALRAARQVTGAGTYLSWMVTGDPCPRKSAIYGVTIVCLDEVTDELGEMLHPDLINDAIEGRPVPEPLEVVPFALRESASPSLADALRMVAKWQDNSLRQEENPGPGELQEITAGKGGWSAVGHLRMMTEYPSQSDQDFAHFFGTLMQLLDDYLDQPEDEQAGIATLYTAGDWDSERLAERIKTVETVARGRYGDTPAVRRFFGICRLHRRIAQLRNETPLDPTRLVPWYL